MFCLVTHLQIERKNAVIFDDAEPQLDSFEDELIQTGLKVTLDLNNLERAKSCR